MLTNQQKELNKILTNHGFDFIDAQEVEGWKSDDDDMRDMLQDRIGEQDITYYSKAMKYLAEEDASLMEAFELASDMGYETKSLNSELLATILYQQRLNEKLGNLMEALEAFEFESTEEAAI